jgi:hypothetical protein
MNGVQASPPWVAFQDGAGAWQQLTSSGGAYELTITDPAGRYGVAWVCDDTVLFTESGVTIIQATVAELPAPQGGCEASVTPTGGTITGTLSGLGAGEAAAIRAGIYAARVTANTFSLGPLENGSYDIVATRSDASFVMNRMIILRNTNVTGNQAQNFDFAAQGFAPTSNQITVTGAMSGETTFATGRFSTNRGTVLNASSGNTYWGIPAAELAQHDMHTVTGGVTTATPAQRQVTHFLHTPANATLALPAVFTMPTISVVATTPQVRFKASLTLLSGAYGYVLRYSVGGTTATRGFVANVSNRWLASSTEYSLPELGSVTGWNSSWNIRAGEATAWIVTAIGGNRGFDSHLPRYPSNVPNIADDGLQRWNSSQSGTLVP